MHFTGTGTPYSYSYDVLALGASPSTGPINGFTLGGLPLYSFNLAWIEQPSWHNFLDSIALPNSLPTFVGQVTLSLGTLDADGRASDRVFFNSLTVTPVPLPGAAMLFMSSLFGLVTGARLRKRGNLTA